MTSSAPASPADQLDGTSWVLAAFAGENGTMSPAVTAADAASLNFGADGVLNGSTGCNRIIGTYLQSGSSLTIELGPMTKMACDEAVTVQENAVISNMGKVAAFRSGNDLVLTTADGATLLTYSPGLSSLSDTSWQATGINNGKDAVVTSASTDKATATFAADGTMSGSGGCNTYTTSYTTTPPDVIELGPVAATAMACEDADVTQTEQDFFAALDNVTTYQIDGNTLTLRDADGAMQVVFGLVP